MSVDFREEKKKKLCNALAVAEIIFSQFHEAIYRSECLLVKNITHYESILESTVIASGSYLMV